MAYITESSIADPVERERVRVILWLINTKKKHSFWKVKRGIDFLICLLALALLAIPMLIIALIIFLSDGHSPIFTQTRVGRFGKTFKMYKFRTMVVDADKLLNTVLDNNEMDGPVFKIRDDPRITKIGRFLRRTSLDELPQFFNVLKGDMSLIGPRPPLPREVEHYTEFHKIRLMVTPGITCLWQVQPKRNSIPFEDWVWLDVEYVANRNILLDLSIMLRTVWVMLSGEGE